jgi:hypothetical protein
MSSAVSISSATVAVPLSAIRFSINRVVSRSIPGRTAAAFGTGIEGLPTADSWRVFDRSS